jgi:hypothetical protein
MYEAYMRLRTIRGAAVPVTADRSLARIQVINDVGDGSRGMEMHGSCA